MATAQKPVFQDDGHDAQPLVRGRSDQAIFSRLVASNATKKARQSGPLQPGGRVPYLGGIGRLPRIATAAARSGSASRRFSILAPASRAGPIKKDGQHVPQFLSAIWRARR